MIPLSRPSACYARGGRIFFNPLYQLTLRNQHRSLYDGSVFTLFRTNTFACLLLSAVAIALTSQSAGAQSRSARKEKSTNDHTLIKEARKLLIAEAEQAKETKQLPTLSADFAKRFNKQIPAEDLTAAILERVHRDTFIDAYVRWQFTSFDPALPDFTDQQFAQFMNNIPSFIDNPRADSETVYSMKNLSKSGRQLNNQWQQFEEFVSTLDSKTQLAEIFNEPARSFADWVQTKLGKTGHLPRLWLLARCAATIDAGWSTQSIKTKISRQFTDSVKDETFTSDQRRHVIKQAQRIVDRKRVFVNEITYLADGSVRVSFSTCTVTQKNVKNWSDRLAGIKPP